MLRKTKTLALASVATAMIAPQLHAAAVKSYQKLPDGLLLSMNPGTMKVQLCTDRIARILYSPTDGLPDSNSLAVIAKWGPVKWDLKETPKALDVVTSAMKVRVNKESGEVSFLDKAGKVLLKEVPGGRKVTPADVKGLKTNNIEQKFVAGANEAYYGLGCLQQDKLDYRGQVFELYQQNTIDITPVLMSSKGYAILWDNPSYGKINIVGDSQVLTEVTQPDSDKPGFKGEYYSGEDFKELKATKIDPVIDFNWKRQAPAEGVSPEHNSIRWTGNIKAPKSGRYTFVTETDDGVRLWVNGKLIIDNWSADNLVRRVGGIELEAGKTYSIKMEYFQSRWNASAKLSWQIPSKDQSVTWWSEAGDAVDYYFMYGPDMDEVIAGYRQATGAAPLYGKWAYGFWQCKEHYHTQQELLDVAETYRSKKIPVDNIVQDWYYWVPEPWGSHAFDPERYPDMPGTIKTLHDKYNMHVMISVWPKFDPGSKNYDELKSAGLLWDAIPPCSPYYDPFSAKGREIYWRQMKDQLFDIGIDAWWLDATEPEICWPIRPDPSKGLMTGMGPAANLWSAYPLMTNKAVYEGQRAATSDKRVYILTRSCYAGIQRYGATVWSGDIIGNWDVYKTQVASGLNFCMTGIPYWCTDIGGFESRSVTDPDYRELFIRWFQWGMFNPIFRVHGTKADKEIYRLDAEGQKILTNFDNLRYRLMPYIYSTAWMVTDQGYTMMRALPMDFRTDPKVLNISDQFMFGPSLLINPVMEKGATTRKFYLPKGKWYSFWTGKTLTGGVDMEVPVTLAGIPIYARAGSIIPMGPFMQYSTEKPYDPIEIRVYRGADGQFAIYEDENDNYNYEKGSHALIPITWNEAKQTLTIGARKGEFPGMLKTRTFKIVLVGDGHGAGMDIEAKPDRVVEYDGTAVVVKL